MDRETFSTGAVRSNDRANVRYDLISPIGLRRLAETYAEGSAKYGDYNWLKGIPASNLLNHIIAHLNDFIAGVGSEDHIAHAAWGLFAIMHFQETRPELLDVPHRVTPTIKLESLLPEKLQGEPIFYDHTTSTVIPKSWIENSVAPFPNPGVYQLFGGPHNFQGEYRYVNSEGSIFCFENGGGNRNTGHINSPAFSGVELRFMYDSVETYHKLNHKSPS